MSRPNYRFTLNGEEREASVPGMRRLLDVLREDLGLTGTKEGCGEGECGACSVILDGQVVDSCLVPVCQVDGADVRTVEGLADAETRRAEPAPGRVPEAGGAQCGICTPGMLMAAQAYLDDGGGTDEDGHPHGHRRQPVSLHRLHQDHRRYRARGPGRGRDRLMGLEPAVVSPSTWPRHTR